jgi:hypothetical protein
MLRYFDLDEIVKFINTLEKGMQRVAISWRIISGYSGNNDDLYKLYYLCLLNSIARPTGLHTCGYFVANMRPEQSFQRGTAVPGAMITTDDAHTDGPTIFLAENVEEDR